jgi:superfamily II DNA or RNA helicase
MKLRDHQKECIKLINEHFKVNNKALIKMFCGSGKSFIIYDTILKYCNNLSVVVVPSINLITQFNKDYLLNEDKIKYNNKNYKLDFELLTICSKNELDKNNLYFTTDDKEIYNFLKIKKSKIILITYQSLEVLINVITKLNYKIDILCFDEAHHILGDGMKKLLFGYDIDEDYEVIEEAEIIDNTEEVSDVEYFSEEDNEEEQDDNINFIDNFVDKTLFLTATPKNSNGIIMFEPITEITIDDKYYELNDDIDSYYGEELHCGKMIYEYMHYSGVIDNILNDFNIRIDLYTENTNNSIFEAISRTILETGNNRVLTFHSRSETKSEKNSDVLSFISKENKIKFKKIFNKILEEEFPELKHKYIDFHFNGITGKTKDKLKILDKFDNTPDDEIYILASCKTIGEGVDTKNANMIVFVDPKQSYVEIIQNIGRACRKNKNTKRNATVLIPAFVDVNKYKDCETDAQRDDIIRTEMSKTGDFNGILNVLSALRQEDSYMFELCLKYPDFFTDKEIKDNLKKNNIELKDETTKEKIFLDYDLEYDENKNEKDNFIDLSNKINKNIQIVNNKVNDEDIYIDNGYDDGICIVKKDDKYIKTEGRIKKKIEKCNRNIKPKVHTNDEIKVLWKLDSDIDINKKIFGGYIKAEVIDNRIENWMSKLEEVKKYIDENNKTPSKIDKDKVAAKLGYWLSTQKNNYKKQKKKYEK